MSPAASTPCGTCAFLRVRRTAISYVPACAAGAVGLAGSFFVVGFGGCTFALVAGFAARDSRAKGETVTAT